MQRNWTGTIGANAREALGRVAIVDIDVDHGNGRQAMFYDDSRVRYVRPTGSLSTPAPVQPTT